MCGTLDFVAVVKGSPVCLTNNRTVHEPNQVIENLIDDIHTQMSEQQCYYLVLTGGIENVYIEDARIRAKTCAGVRRDVGWRKPAECVMI